MRDDYIVFGAPDIRQAEIQEVVDTLRSGWIGTGPRVGRFEIAFGEYVGARNAVAVHSCTAALHLSMLMCGIEPGDEVITTPLTFAATANAIIHAGGVPRFVDIDRRTQNIDPARVRRFLEEDCSVGESGLPVNAATGRPVRALLPVHVGGRPCDVDELRRLSETYGLLLIEDAAHAVGAKIGSRPIGSTGDLTCFSFYVTKNLVTGEGGMITTDDDDLAAKLKILASHGMSADAWKRYNDEGFRTYEVVAPGFKANMMDLQAALGIHQLLRQEEVLARREEVWHRYDEAFADLPVDTPLCRGEGTRHARHLYTLMIDEARSGVGRDEAQLRLHETGIGTGIHYLPVHLHEYYRNHFGYERGMYPMSEWVGDRTLSLPLSSRVTDDEVARVIRAVRGILVPS